jgi:hypothetical protein
MTSTQDRRPTEYTNAIALAKAAQAYADAIKRAMDKERPHFTSREERAMFDLCNAGINVVDDGDFMRQRQVIMDDNGWNEHGESDFDADERAANYMLGYADMRWKEGKELGL